MNYDVIIIGAGPGGIFAAYELMKKKPAVIQYRMMSQNTVSAYPDLFTRIRSLRIMAADLAIY